MKNANQEKIAKQTWNLWGPQCGFPFEDFQRDTNRKECVVVYHATNVTKQQIRNFDTNQQRHFVQTTTGTKQRICLTHLNENCLARSGLLTEQAGCPLEFSLDCVIDATTNKNQEFQCICSLHADKSCFAAVNFYYDGQKNQDQSMPKLTCATIDMLSLHADWLDPIVLFALDHMNVKLEPVIEFVCQPYRALFAESYGDIDTFLAAAIHPFILNWNQKLLITRAIKKLWFSFDRTSSQCFIQNCVCHPRQDSSDV